MSAFRPWRISPGSWRAASFGAAPEGERLARIRRSAQFVDGEFRNPVVTRSVLQGSALPMARTQLSRDGRLRRAPVGEIPVHRPTVADWGRPPQSGLRITWMGHSSVLAEIDGRRVLFDPVWGDRCSPFTWIGPRRLHPVPLPLAELLELAPVDVVVISHDHYDHLDMPTIKGLVHTDAAFVAPLGVGADLEFWGVPADRITELDWNESTDIGELTFTATPAQHFCGRGLRGPQHTLWASWVVKGPHHRLFHSGDTGYFPGFAEIGATHGPFDATMIQIGAYSEFWPDIHMTPEEGLRAHTDLGRGTPQGALLPIHWGTFNLAPHPWADPIERIACAVLTAGAKLAAPVPGKPFEPAADLAVEPWWRAIAVPSAQGWPCWPPLRTAPPPATDDVPTYGPGRGTPVRD